MSKNEFNDILSDEQVRSIQFHPDLLKKPIDLNKIKITEVDSLGGLFKGLFVNCIKWNRVIGAPLSSRMSDAFSIHVWRFQEVLEFMHGGAARWVKLKVPVPVRTFDYFSDPETFGVCYSCSNMREGETYHVSVEFDSQVDWPPRSELVGKGPLEITPESLSFRFLQDSVATHSVRVRHGIILPPTG
jgi:hypothetical protein